MQEQDIAAMIQGYSKEIEALKSTQSLQNEKYQNFLKEKLIFQTERDNMMNEMKNIEGLL